MLNNLVHRKDLVHKVLRFGTVGIFRQKDFRAGVLAVAVIFATHVSEKRPMRVTVVLIREFHFGIHITSMWLEFFLEFITPDLKHLMSFMGLME